MSYLNMGQFCPRKSWAGEDRSTVSIREEFRNQAESVAREIMARRGIVDLEQDPLKTEMAMAEVKRIMEGSANAVARMLKEEYAPILCDFETAMRRGQAKAITGGIQRTLRTAWEGMRRPATAFTAAFRPPTPTPHAGIALRTPPVRIVRTR